MTTAVEQSWTRLGTRLGLTRTVRQRADIIAATQAIAWADCDEANASLADPALHAVVATLFGSRLEKLHRSGAVALPDGSRLIGLQDGRGQRTYIVTQPTPGAAGWLSEAVVVMRESTALTRVA